MGMYLVNLGGGGIIRSSSNGCISRFGVVLHHFSYAVCGLGFGSKPSRATAFLLTFMIHLNILDMHIFTGYKVLCNSLCWLTFTTHS